MDLIYFPVIDCVMTSEDISKPTRPRLHFRNNGRSFTSSLKFRRNSFALEWILRVLRTCGLSLRATASKARWRNNIARRNTCAL
jgi:hypothetical protein